MNRKLMYLAVSAVLLSSAGAPAFATSFHLRSFSPGLRAPTLAAQAAQLQLIGSPEAAQDFGAVSLGSSKQLGFSLVNSGSAQGSLSLPAFGGTNPEDFSATSTCANVPVSGSCDVTVAFQPQQAGSRASSLNIAGTDFSFSGTAAVATSYVFLTAGTSYTIPAGVTSVEAWAVGGGGGGAGTRSISTDAGGGGAAGGLAYVKWTVEPGQTLSYAIAAGGAPGYNGSNGSSGGTTTVSYSGQILSATGGGGGKFGLGVSVGTSIGGNGSGGSASSRGGAGGGAPYGNNGAGGGGAIGQVAATTPTGSAGTNGAKATYLFGLDTALFNAGVSFGAPGAGASSGAQDAQSGGTATGFGNGGGGAGSLGGNGGNGVFGGGGGGSHSLNTQARTGGRGGDGAVVLKLN